MKNKFIPKTELEKFGLKIFFLLVENFPQTFFVGGAVRDMLLGIKITDIDIATEGSPEKVMQVLQKNNVKASDTFKQFGVIAAFHKNIKIEIATLRTEKYETGRYPSVTFIKSPKLDSVRRDFTINALYLQPNTGRFLDFHDGKTDLQNRELKFIGNPKKRIHEDPLRIVRALRFSLDLGLMPEKKTLSAIKNNFNSLKNISASRIETEIKKIKLKKSKKIIGQVINNQAFLDKYFK